MSRIRLTTWGYRILISGLVIIVLAIAVAAFFIGGNIIYIPEALFYPSFWAESWIPWTVAAGGILLLAGIILLVLEDVRGRPFSPP